MAQQPGAKTRKRNQAPKIEVQSPPDKKLKIEEQPPHMEHSPNSNSFSMIYDQYYPRTPVKTVKESAGKQKQNKDQLDQLLEKGILDIALVQQVSFNSTKPFTSLKNTIDCGFKQPSKDADQALLNQLKANLELCQYYEKKVRRENNDLSLFTQKQGGESENIKQLHTISMINVYNHYRQNMSEDTFFLYANPLFMTLFAYKSVSIPIQQTQIEQESTNNITPFALYITRSSAISHSFTLGNQVSQPQFLTQNHIKSETVSIDPLLNNLIPSVISLQFPTKYSVNIIKGKYIHQLFNVLLNSGTDKESADIIAPYQFQGSKPNFCQIFNGIDAQASEIDRGQRKGIFDESQSHTEYKMTYDGIFTIKQVLNLKETIKKLGFEDVVVSETRLNPITTLLTQNTSQKITKLLQQL